MYCRRFSDIRPGDRVLVQKNTNFPWDLTWVNVVKIESADRSTMFLEDGQTIRWAIGYIPDTYQAWAKTTHHLVWSSPRNAVRNLWREVREDDSLMASEKIAAAQELLRIEDETREDE